VRHLGSAVVLHFEMTRSYFLASRQVEASSIKEQALVMDRVAYATVYSAPAAPIQQGEPPMKCNCRLLLRVRAAF
jgi:hypothetical protein